MKSLFLGVAVVMLSGAAAVAGPVGSGLGLTEEVARRAVQQRTITVAQADQACARQAAQIVRSSDGVAWAKVRPDGVHVTFHSGDHASRHEAKIRAVVTETCAAV